MGYQTWYTLNVYQFQDYVDEGEGATTIPHETAVIEELRAASTEAEVALDEYGGGNDWIDWDTCEKEVKELSEKHLGLLFVIEGAGECDDDHWRLFALSGQVQIVTGWIQYEEPDFEQLRNWSLHLA